MDRFIRRENITLFRRRLAEATTEEQRKVILQLLAEEEAKDGILRAGQGDERRKTKDASIEPTPVTSPSR
jgi:hypothetical protein